MKRIQVLTDSCSDLSKELLQKYGIDYCRMNTVHNEEETPASLLWEYYTPHELYEMMRAGERVKTTQVPPAEFTRVFTKYLEEGCDILYVGCSSKQSGSVNTATVVAKKLKENYTDANIFCVDSLNASMGEGLLAIRAAELAAEGRSVQEVYETVLSLRNCVNQYVTVHSLRALERAGRVTASAAFFGNLMGVKPILISDADGVQTPIKKAKGRMNSFKEMVEMLSNSITAPETQTVYVAHADCSAAELAEMERLIKASIPCRDVVSVYIGPIIGASIGPDAIGIWAFGNEVTYRVGEVK